MPITLIRNFTRDYVKYNTCQLLLCTYFLVHPFEKYLEVIIFGVRPDPKLVCYGLIWLPCSPYGFSACCSTKFMLKPSLSISIHACRRTRVLSSNVKRHHPSILPTMGMSTSSEFVYVLRTALMWQKSSGTTSNGPPAIQIARHPTQRCVQRVWQASAFESQNSLL